MAKTPRKKKGTRRTGPRIISKTQHIKRHLRRFRDGKRHYVAAYDRHVRVWRVSGKPVRKQRPKLPPAPPPPPLPPEEPSPPQLPGTPPEAPPPDKAPPETIAPLNWIEAQDLLSQFLPDYETRLNYQNEVTSQGFQDLPGWAEERRSARGEMKTRLGKSWAVLPVWAIDFDHEEQQQTIRSLTPEEEEAEGNTVTGWLDKQDKNLSPRAKTVIDNYLEKSGKSTRTFLDAPPGEEFRIQKGKGKAGRPSMMGADPAIYPAIGALEERITPGYMIDKHSGRVRMIEEFEDIPRRLLHTKKKPTKEQLLHKLNQRTEGNLDEAARVAGFDDSEEFRRALGREVEQFKRYGNNPEFERVPPPDVLAQWLKDQKDVPF